jgi:heme/copper-type cytochrome/quinol oxidase subunit 3
MIPYTVDRRPDTGVTNVTMGVWLLVASEVMLFGALLSAYALLRTAAPAWPAGRVALSVPTGATTVALMMVVVALTWRARRASPRAIPRWLGAGTVVAALFVLVQAAEYVGLAGEGTRPASSTFFAMYFTLTGLHVLHVLIGAAANVWVLAGSRRVPDRLTHGRLHALTVYWTFVAAVWFVVFGLLYLS